MELSYGSGVWGLRVATKDVKYDFESSLSMNVKVKAKDKKLRKPLFRPDIRTWDLGLSDLWGFVGLAGVRG